MDAHTGQASLELDIGRFEPGRPFNELPLLPPQADLETVPVLKKSTQVQVALAELRAAGTALPNQSFLVKALQIQEAKQSSEIENIVTTNDALYQALDDTQEVADPAAREVLRYSDALWMGYMALQAGRPISPSLMLEVARTVKYPEIGLRTLPGTVIANSATGQVLYTPPEGEVRLQRLLDNLCEYWATDDDADPIVKLAVGHYQFEAIHPFPDGNGRTGRILMMLYLLDRKLLDVPTLYLSRPILANKGEYYRRLLGVTQLGDWNSWVEYMLDVALAAATDALVRIRKIRGLMQDVGERARTQMKRGYSVELVQLLFRLPYIRIRDLERAGIAKRDAASMYLRELERLEILSRVKVGREAIYFNDAYLRALID